MGLTGRLLLAVGWCVGKLVYLASVVPSSEYYYSGLV